MSPVEASYVEPARRMSANGWATLLIFLPPALLLFTVFVALPMAEAGWYGFYNWNGYGRPEKFIGLKNYGYLIGNATFTRSLINNGLIIVVSLLVQLPLALGVAHDGGRTDRRRGRVPDDLLSALCPGGRRGGADLALHVRRRLRSRRASITGALGLAPYYLLADKTWAFSAVLIVVLWKYFGFHMMLYVAGLQGIDKSLLEAAEMDGATAFQRFRHITLPLLGPMIRLSIFFSVVGALQLFDVIVPLTGGGPFETTNTMVSYLYYFGITRMRVGFGSAVGVVLFLICVTFAFGYRRLFMRDD